jgi:hypothetical protein
MPRRRPRGNTFTIAFDLVDTGWLLVEIDDGRGQQRIHMSYLTFALDDLLAALISLARGEQRARVSWDSEPTEYRWLCVVDNGYARVRVLHLADRVADLPDHDGHLILHTDLPLQELVRSVTSAARTLLNRVGEEAYARRWKVRPFPTTLLLALERWLDES